jgi:hypothetical protein
MEEVRLPPHVPTSVALTRLLEDAPADRVSLAWLISRLGKTKGLRILDNKSAHRTEVVLR